MPEVAVVFLDNALNSQNQDYLPSRFILQKEIIDTIITAILERDPESLIGLIPLAQNGQNDILTPTKNRPYLSTYLHKSDLQDSLNHTLSLYLAKQSFSTTELSTKTLVIFLCTPVENVEELMAELFDFANKDITIKLVCFGDCVELGYLLQQEIDTSNFSCLVLDSDNMFNDKVLSFLGSAEIEQDPELEEAIRRSLQQQ